LKKISGRCIFFCTFFILLLAIQACKKDEEIGIIVQPPEDKIVVGFNNGSGIVAYSIRDDSIKTDETLLNLLGSYFDPILGTSTAGFYVQIRTPDNNVNFGPNPVIDSVILTLAYNGGYYGDLTAQQSVNVFEVTQDFFIDSNYYSNNRLYCSATDLCDVSFFPKPTDSVVIGGVNYVPHVRLKLNNSLGQKFLDASGTSALYDNTNFLMFFKGLYIVAEPRYVSGAMLYFNLLSSQSKLTLYSHNDSTSSQTYSFVINENSGRFNTFEHNGYSGADHGFQQQIAGDTSRGEQTLYLQTMGGIKTYIRFPDIRSLLDSGNVAINKAELIITADPATLEGFTPPTQLTLVKINSDGSLGFLPDQYYGTDYWGGTYNSTTKEYRFNIAKYIQYALTDETYAANGLYLAISGSAVNGNRLVLNGPAKESGNLRLEITYTRLN
jgi:hypothetical protein